MELMLLRKQKKNTLLGRIPRLVSRAFNSCKCHHCNSTTLYGESRFTCYGKTWNEYDKKHYKLLKSNPSQTPVLAAECPIFAQCKYILWKWPEEFGEKLFIVMFGGLHIEKALWTIIGEILTPSGWTNSLSDATVSTTGKADSDLKSSHITRTRKDHHITALTLTILQHEAYQLMNTLPQKPFDMRKKEMVETSNTFYFSDLILRLEMQVLIFIKYIRENNFVFVFCS
jgi:hypothetical protein